MKLSLVTLVASSWPMNHGADTNETNTLICVYVSVIDHGDQCCVLVHATWWEFIWSTFAMRLNYVLFIFGRDPTEIMLRKIVDETWQKEVQTANRSFCKVLTSLGATTDIFSNWKQNEGNLVLSEPLTLRIFWG